MKKFFLLLLLLVWVPFTCSWPFFAPGAIKPASQEVSLSHPSAEPMSSPEIAGNPVSEEEDLQNYVNEDWDYSVPVATPYVAGEAAPSLAGSSPTGEVTSSAGTFVLSPNEGEPDSDF